MNVAYINPFVHSTATVFETMLGVKLTRGQVYLKTGDVATYGVSAILGLSGKAKGTVVLSLNPETACRMAEALLGERPEDINPVAVDAVGEVANMIAGGAKAQLEQLDLRMTVPTIIIGDSFRIEFPSRIPPVCIPFESPFGALTVEVGLVEQKTEASLLA